jgi:hypothetical protein
LAGSAGDAPVEGPGCQHQPGCRVRRVDGHESCDRRTHCVRRYLA